MNFEVHIKSPISATVMGAAMQAAVRAVSVQALKDCNFYCKQDTNALIASSLIHSDLDSGVLRWVEPYAEFQYTFPNTRTVINPNARPRWCEAAEENHKDEWQSAFTQTYNRELGI